MQHKRAAGAAGDLFIIANAAEPPLTAAKITGRINCPKSARAFAPTSSLRTRKTRRTNIWKDVFFLTKKMDETVPLKWR